VCARACALARVFFFNSFKGSLSSTCSPPFFGSLFFHLIIFPRTFSSRASLLLPSRSPSHSPRPPASRRQVPHGSTAATDALAEALERAKSRFPRFFERRKLSTGGPLRAASESGLEVVLEEGDAIFFPAFWFHHTESLELSFSLGYRYLDVKV
jgi:hypothetical protein